MKVLMVDSLVGSEYSFCLCSHLMSAEVEVSLVVTEDRNEAFHAPIDFPLKKWLPSKNDVCSKPRKAFKYLQYLFKVFAHGLSPNVDLLHFQFFRLERIEWLLFLALKALGLKLAYTAHDVLPPERKTADFFLKRLVYRASNTIFVHSAHIKNLLVENFKIRSEKIEIVPHGNYDNYLPQRRMTQLEARQDLGLNENDQVLLFFGIIREYKGLDLLLDAFEGAATANPLLKLVIAGAPLTPALRERYAHRIGGLASKERVIYHAEFIPVEKVAGYFVACDAVVLPYQKIYHSGVLHLAYSFGKPVVATRVGDFPETIEHGKSGFLLETNDAQSFVQVILNSFTKPEALMEMGKYARHLSETKYSWKAVAQKTKQAYASMVKSR